MAQARTEDARREALADARRVLREASVPGPANAGDPAPSELDERKLAVLRTIVTQYVATAEPIGSKRVVETAGLDVSAATVRNDMALLEDLGYISQPHTSAGRIPTTKGYRTFVDELSREDTSDDPRREVVRELLGTAHDVEDLLARTTTALSQLTRLVSLVIAPAMDASRLKLVELVPMTNQTALLLLVSDTGRVHKRFVEFATPVPDSDIERMRGVLHEHVRGRRMGEVNDAVTGLLDGAPSDLREPLASLVVATEDGLAGEVMRQVFVGGQAALAGEQGVERRELYRLLELLEERDTLARLLAESTLDEDSTVVRIGGENDVRGLEATSLVAKRYQLVSSGSLGVLGPTRMDYGAVLSTVKTVAEQLQETLRTLSE